VAKAKVSFKQYGRDHRGDIVITLNVEIPKGISSETRVIIKIKRVRKKEAKIVATTLK
jgi:hypothetical protein